MAMFQGPYNPESAYADVGNVVTHDDGNVYKVLRPAPAGAYPTDTHYWGKVDGITAEVMNLLVGLFTDLFEAVQTIPKNIDAESISLKSGDDEYLITVDATGDTPELAVELIEEEGDGD